MSVYIYTYVQSCRHMYILLHVYIYAYIQTHAWLIPTYRHSQTDTNLCLPIYSCIHIFIHTYMQLCLYMCI